MKTSLITTSILLTCLLTSCGQPAHENEELEPFDKAQGRPEKEQITNFAKEQKAMQKIVRTPSGLGYEITKPAPAPKKPRPGQVVTVHYTGWLDEGNGKKGRKFDSSVDRGQAFEFMVGARQVIPGWDEALLDMSPGEKRTIYIPANLGYGAQGAGGGVIPPHANLIFDVELLGVR